MQVFKATDHVVAGIGFTPDGRGLVVSAHPHLTVWDVTGTPQPTRQFKMPLYGGVGMMSPCGRFLVCAGSGLWVFDLTTDEEKPAWSLDGDWTHVAFAPDGTELAKAAVPPRQWAVPSWDRIRFTIAPPSADTPHSCAIAYAPDGRTIALAVGVRVEDGPRVGETYIRLFDRASGVQTADLHMPFGHSPPTHIAFSPDGAVVAGNFGPVLGVVSVADGKQVARIKVGTKHITALAFTPDGSKFVTVSNDTRVRVYDTLTWTETAGYEWKIGKLRCVAVAPDGFRMAAGSDRGKVVIWDVDG